MVHICAWTSCLLKVAILHHFPSRVGLCLLRFVSLFIYGLFCRPLSGTTSLPGVRLMVHICAILALKSSGLNNINSIFDNKGHLERWTCCNALWAWCDASWLSLNFMDDPKT